MPRPKHPMLGRIRDRIEAEYAKNSEYTFTVLDFYDIAVTPNQRKIIGADFSKRSSGKPGRSSTLRVVGKVPGGQFSLVNLYQVVSVPIANLTTFKAKGRKQYYVRKTAKEDVYKRRHQPAPAYVLELQNILFGMKGRVHEASV